MPAGPDGRREGACYGSAVGRMNDDLPRSSGGHLATRPRGIA